MTIFRISVGVVSCNDCVSPDEFADLLDEIKKLVDESNVFKLNSMNHDYTEL